MGGGGTLLICQLGVISGETNIFGITKWRKFLVSLLPNVSLKQDYGLDNQHILN